LGIIIDRGILTEFDSDESSLSVSLLPNQPRTLLGTINLTIDDVTDRVWLTGTIHFVVSAFAASVPPFGLVAIEIFRNDPTFTTTPIFYTEDSGTNTGQVNRFTTSFSTVDETPTVGPVTYFITGRLVARDPAINEIIASLRHFTGAEIEANSI
jgi:hypothetical protein